VKFNKTIKKDLVNNLSKKTGFSNLFSNKIIDDFFDVLTDYVKRKDLNLKNLGTFKINLKKERVGRNPKTKESFIITARKTISFVTSKNLQKLINK
jgi:integration host factor subunit alpha